MLGTDRHKEHVDAEPERPIMTPLQHTAEALRRRGSRTDAIDAHVADLCGVASVAEAQRLLAVLETDADALDWPRDRDYAALALQTAAPTAVPEVARLMLRSALARAQWCAACATSGAEGLARSQHVLELQAALDAQA
ncbi:hypothetical protein G9274_003190 [Stenotrophomonas rhizophila]|nr:hypothetical protein G9274_003190 [Stenotrophomonas rhizophila]